MEKQTNMCLIKNYNDVVDNAEILKKPILTRNQTKIKNILTLLRQIAMGSLYEQSDTTESE